MKPRRQVRILDIVRTSLIETQEQLVEALAREGVHATQATVSRDIRELGLVKAPTGDGRVRYALPDTGPTPSAHLLEIFRTSVLHVDHSGNTVVLTTLPATAAAVAEAVDSLHVEGVIGTLSGERTVFVVVKPPERSPEVAARLRAMIG
ncbi:MAG: arginine repressor [Firmicutes bacterium]|nr:arginine repressor [Bacillota bacterium]